MDEAEKREGREFDYLVSHHAFTNAMTGAQIVERRKREGKSKLRQFILYYNIPYYVILSCNMTEPTITHIRVCVYTQ